MNFYAQVPKTLKENLQYRIKVRKRAQDDERFRRALITACRHDVLFFFNVFGWLFEPRPRVVNGVQLPTTIPFITWPHQDKAILKADEHLGFRDLGAEKARGEGASWIGAWFAIRDWTFEDMAAVGLVSRTEDAVDSPDDPDSLMWKALTVDAPVLTPKGWKRNGDLDVGDYVVGRNGKPTRIAGVHDHGLKPVFRVKFHDGTSVRCSGDHLWTVTHRRDRCSKMRFKREQCPEITVSTKEMAESYVWKPGFRRHGSAHPYTGVLPGKTCWRARIKVNGRYRYLGTFETPELASDAYQKAKQAVRKPVKKGSRQHVYQIPRVKPVEFQEGSEELTIPPYTLGALLGDGGLSSTSINLSGVDDEVFQRVSEELPECEFSGTNPKCKIISGGDLSQRVRDVGLRGHRAWEKFVPKEYLLASIDDRLSLLRGIMDTDGWVTSTDGKRAESSHAFLEVTSRQLAEDTAFIVRSLGGLAFESKSYDRSYSYKGEKLSGRQAYRIGVVMPENPFHIRRKADLYRERKITDKVVVGVEPDGEDYVRCITVESLDSLYVTEGMTLTHNCDWGVSKLPRWMVGQPKKDYVRNRQEHSLKNLRNNSTIVGYAATGDIASGGRKRWFLMDELAKFPRGPDEEAMASTQYVTDSRFIVSTPKGSEGAYYEAMHEPSSMVKIVLDWKDNPTRNQGLYKLEGNIPKAVDPENNPLPEHYDPSSKDVLDLFSRLRRKGFKLEGMIRSPWFDGQCDRPRATPQSVAQELERDYGGSMYKIFGAEFTDKAKASVRQPSASGVLDYHPETLEPEFSRTDGGPLKLWTLLDARGCPPPHPYAVGVDVSSGLGGSFTSNSAAVVIDCLTLEQVAELATNTVQPADFADQCIALSKWFNKAYLIWEHNGPGTAFTRQVVGRNYPNVYYRTQIWRNTRKKTKDPGWWTDERSKEVMFGELGRSVRSSEITLRSENLVHETGQYVRVNGKITHSGAANTKDDSSKGTAHGDRVIAAAVCLQAIHDRPEQKDEDDYVNDNPPPGTMAWRYKQWELSQEENTDGWDARTNWQLAQGSAL